MRRSIVRITAVVTVVAATSCSLVLSNGPPAQHHQLPTFECSTSRVPPAVDSTFAAGNLAVGLVWANTCVDGSNCEKPPSPLLPLAAAAIWAASAAYGFSKTGKCRVAKEELWSRKPTDQPAARPELTTSPHVVPSVTPPAPSDPSGVEARLRKLEDLRAAGMISDDEYQRKRKDIVDSL